MNTVTNLINVPDDEDVDLGYLEERPALIPEGNMKSAIAEPASVLRGSGETMCISIFRSSPLASTSVWNCTCRFGCQPPERVYVDVPTVCDHSGSGGRTRDLPHSRRDRFTAKVFKGKAFRARWKPWTWILKNANSPLSTITRELGSCWNGPQDSVNEHRNL